MKVDKDALRALSEKNDTELWAEITRMAKSRGFNLPDAAPRHEDMEKIRSAMRGSEKIGIGDAMRIMNSCKKK